MVIAVAAAPGHLEIVRLAGLDAADAGAAAGNVQDHRRHLGAGQEAKPLLHQGDARGGGGNEHAAAGSACAIGHVDGAQFAFRLDKAAAPLRQLPGHILWDLALGGDGVAEIVLATAPHGGFREGLVAFHQNLFRHSASPSSSR